MKILIAGDWHGDCNAQSVAHNPSVSVGRSKKASSIMAIDAAAKHGAEHIIQCGDFGLWPGWFGFVFLDRLNAALIESNVQLIWLDGNHEDFDQLDRFVKFNPQNEKGQTFIRSNILYSPRGCGWTWDHKRFLTVGGAHSIDKEWRTEGESWWPQETLTDAQVNGIISNAKARRVKGKPEVDYMFTHDCHPNTPFRHRLKPDLDSQFHREKMREIALAVRPGIWFHGHMHTKYDWKLSYAPPFSEESGKLTQVYGLADGREKDSWGILDTEDDSFTFETDFRKGMFDD